MDDIPELAPARAGLLLNGGDIDTIEPEAYEVSFASAIDIAEGADVLAHRPTMQQIEGGRPAAGQTERAARRKPDVHAILTKAHDVGFAIAIHIS